MSRKTSHRVFNLLARRSRARRVFGAETGATLVEYSLLLALVAVVAAGGLAYLGKAVNQTLGKVAAQIAGDDVSQIFVDGSPCTTDPCTETVLAYTTYRFTLSDPTGPVTYTYPTNLNNDLGFTVNGGALDMSLVGLSRPGRSLSRRLTASTTARP